MLSTMIKQIIINLNMWKRSYQIIISPILVFVSMLLLVSYSLSVLSTRQHNASALILKLPFKDGFMITRLFVDSYFNCTAFSFNGTKWYTAAHCVDRGVPKLGLTPDDAVEAKIDIIRKDYDYVILNTDKVPLYYFKKKTAPNYCVGFVFNSGLYYEIAPTIILDGTNTFIGKKVVDWIDKKVQIVCFYPFIGGGSSGSPFFVKDNRIGILVAGNRRLSFVAIPPQEIFAN